MQTLLGLSIKIKALAIKLSFSTFKTLSGEAKRQRKEKKMEEGSERESTKGRVRTDNNRK